MAETLSVCLYDTEHLCSVLTRLFIEFDVKIHKSLVYGTLLPQYCQACPHLEDLRSKKLAEEE